MCMSLLSSIDPLYVLSGFGVGFLVGQTGMGGGALMTPILVLLFGVHPTTAVGTDLLFAAATKTIGTLAHSAHHTVNWGVVGWLASGSVPATAITLLVISHFDMSGAQAGDVISHVLGVMLLLTAAALIFRRQFLVLVGERLERLPAQWTAVLTVLTGMMLGVLVTISSVGAGAIGVTALLLLYPLLPMATIIGSDVAHAVPLTLVAGIGHWWIGSVAWLALGPLLVGSVPGILIGSYAAVRVPAAVLRPILAATLCLVGSRLLF
jgi:uncharacterized protein